MHVFRIVLSIKREPLYFEDGGTGLPTLGLKKSGNFAKCLTYGLPSAIGPQKVSAEKGRSSHFYLGSQKFICKIE